MRSDEFASAVEGELAKIEEVYALAQSISLPNASVHEIAAVGLYLQNIYRGVEHTLVRIARYYGVGLPEGSDWHKQLISLFESAATPPLPVLFPEDMTDQVHLLRGFRHVLVNNYAFDLDAERISANVQGVNTWLPEWMRRVKQVAAKARAA